MGNTPLDASAIVLPSAASVALTVGASFIPGDLRLVRVTISASRTFGPTPDGWEKIHDQLITGSRRIGVFARYLQDGDTDATLAFDSASGIGRTAITLRGVLLAQTLTPSSAGASSAASALVAPSVTSTDPGTLITWHDVTLTTGANVATMTDPSAPWVRKAYSPSDGAAGYCALIGIEDRATGATGTRTATSSGSGAWAATSLFVVAAPPAATTRHNLSPNPALKTASTGWYGPTGWQRLASGHASLPRGPVFAGSGAGDVITPRFAVTPGKYYRAVTAGRAIARSTIDTYLHWYNGAGVFLGASYGAWYDAAAGTTTTFDTGAGLAPAGAASALMMMEGVDGSAQFTATLPREFDTLAAALAADMSYFDGDTPGATWDSGTNGTSTEALNFPLAIAMPIAPPVGRIETLVRHTTMAIAMPIAPPVGAIGLIAQVSYDDLRGRIRLRVGGLVPEAVRAVVYARVAGTTKWAEIRGGRVAVVAGDFTRTVDHYEFAAGTGMEYRIVALSTPEGVPDVVVQSRVLSVQDGLNHAWLKFIVAPASNRKVVLGEWDEFERENNNALFKVKGRRDPVVITDGHSAPTTVVRFYTQTLDERDALDEALGQGVPIFLHTTRTAALPSMYAVVGTYRWGRTSRRGYRHMFTVPLTVVSAPPLSVYGAGATWQSVLDRFATWQDVLDAYGSWRELTD